MKTKKLLCGFFLSLALLITGIAFTACGEDLPVKILNVSGFESEVVVGVDYDYDNFVAVVKLQSGEEVTITASDLIIDEVDTSEVGTKTINVKYKVSEDKYLSVTIEIDVIADYITGIESISGLDSTISQHDAYDYTGVSAVVNFKSGATQTITANNLTVTHINTFELGEQTITVSYSLAGIIVSKNFTVTVTEDAISKINSVTGYASTIGYGKTYSYASISAEVEYATGYTETLTVADNKLEIQGAIDTAVVSAQQFTVKVKGTNVTKNVSVTVTDGDVEAITDVTGYKAKVVKDSVYNYDNIVVSVRYESGRIEQIKYIPTESSEPDSRIAIGAVDTANIYNAQPITVTYTLGNVEKVETIYIEVCEDYITEILSVGGIQNTIQQHSVYDYAGLYASVIYFSGVQDDSFTALEYNEINTDTVGEKTITVIVSGTSISKDFVVNVTNDYATEITSVIGYSDEVVYDGVYNYSGIEVTVAFESGWTGKTVYAYGDTGLTIDEVDTNQLGEQEIAVVFEYNGQAVNSSFNVTVKYDYAEEFIDVLNVETAVKNGEDFDYSNASAQIKYHFDSEYHIVNTNLDFDVSGLNTFSDGNYLVIVTYTDEHNVQVQKYLTVTVYSDDYITEIENNDFYDFVTKVGLNQEYTVPNDAYVKVKRSTGNKMDVFATNQDLTIDSTAVDTTQVGTYPVSVSFTETWYDEGGTEHIEVVSNTFDVEVCDFVTNVVVGGEYSNMLAYGRDYDKSGATLTLTFASGSQHVIEGQDLTVSVVNNVLGSKYLTFASTKQDYLVGASLVLGAVSAQIEVTVYNFVVSYEISGTYESEVNIFAPYDVSKITLTLTYADGSAAEILNSDLDIEFTNNELGLTNNLIVRYTLDKSATEGQAQDLEIELKETIQVNDYFTSAEVSGTYETTANLNSVYDKSGITLTLNYRSGATNVISSNLVVAGADTSTTGVKQVTVTYGAYQASFNLEVVDFIASYIVGGTYASSVRQYKVYDTSEIKLVAVYESGANEDVEGALAFTGLNTNISGNQTLRVALSTNNNVYAEVTVNVIGVDGYRVAGTYLTEVTMGDVYDYSGIKLVRIYLDEYEEDVVGELEFSGLDTNIVAIQTLLVTLSTDSTVRASIDVVVNEIAEDFEVLGFDEPTFVTLYKTNSQKHNEFVSTGSSAVKGFVVTGNKYVVGDDNNFVFSPMLTVLRDSESDTITEYNARFTVYIYDEDQSKYVQLTDNVRDYVTIDTYHHTLDFTDEAVGSTFKISVVPKLDQAREPIVFEFEVIDGYNIYNATELSVVDNVNYNNVWTAYKTAHNIALDLNIKSAIIHNNISVEKEDLPDAFFWSEEEVAGDPDYDRVLGSLKDSSGEDGRVYYRKVNDGSTFRFEGNYFTISVQNIPVAVRERNQSVSVEGEAITVHTTLFSFNGPNNDSSKITRFELNNISMFGNAKKTENVLMSGGIMSFKKKNCVLVANNMLNQCWSIAMFQDEGDRNPDYDQDDVYMEIKNCTIFDSFNTLIYNWGGTLYINDSVVIGAGGPVMICDHTGHKNDGSGGTVSRVITTNSKLESWVAGTEGWFQIYQATELATSIKQLDQLFNMFYKTILDASAQKMNLIAVYKSAEVQGISTAAIRGTFEDTKYPSNRLDVGSASLNALKQNIMSQLMAYYQDPAVVAQILAQTAVVETYTGAVCIPGDSGLLYPNPVTQDFQVAFLAAQDYANLYLFNGMGVVFGLNNYTPAS